MSVQSDLAVNEGMSWKLGSGTVLWICTMADRPRFFGDEEWVGPRLLSTYRAIVHPGMWAQSINLGLR